MSTVHFASAKLKALNAESSLPAKFQRLLAHFPLGDMFDGRSVAVKVHVGGNLGYSTIPPLFIKLLVNAIKEAGGKPFVTDGSDSIPGAKDRGYTEEVLGCPIVRAAGEKERDYVTMPVGYLRLKDVRICGEIHRAQAMVVFSHGKAHGHCGWGGAIKNIGMGCVPCKSRGDIHALIDTEFDWDSELCVHCYQCRDNCPTGALTFTDKDELNIFPHDCRYCMHCVNSCPEHAIKINEEGIRQFQTGMARVNQVCLSTFEPGRVLFINYNCYITPFCDCWGFTSPAIVPDVGIMAATDIVAVETASLDAIKTEDYIPNTLPPPLIVGERPGHLLEKIHNKDPYLQCEEAEKIGLGSRKYDLTEVE